MQVIDSKAPNFQGEGIRQIDNLNEDQQDSFQCDQYKCRRHVPINLLPFLLYQYDNVGGEGQSDQYLKPIADYECYFH